VRVHGLRKVSLASTLARAAASAGTDHGRWGDGGSAAGTLRLNVTSAADSFLSGATLGGFPKRYIAIVERG
jgi:hypothetical protein